MEYSHRLDLTIAGFPVAVVVQQGDISLKSVLRSGCWCRLDSALTTWCQGFLEVLLEESTHMFDDRITSPRVLGAWTNLKSICGVQILMVLNHWYIWCASTLYFQKIFTQGSFPAKFKVQGDKCDNLSCFTVADDQFRHLLGTSLFPVLLTHFLRFPYGWKIKIYSVPWQYADLVVISYTEVENNKSPYTQIQVSVQSCMGFPGLLV